jgi:predicted lipid-binding transport protein (Tim44 family)
VTQPNTGTNVARPGTQQPAGGGMFNRPGGLFGGGLLGGLAMGFLGAGLFGLLMGNGLLGGLGGLASMFGLLLQVAIVAGIVWFAWTWWQRRQQPALAQAAGPQPSYREMFTGGGSGAAAPAGGGRSTEPTDDLGISPADYDAFEKLLDGVQTAYSNEDISALRKHATPEMVSYFAEDLAENTSRGVVNRLSDVKLLQGDLAEAWREGSTEYATVAMKFSLVDQLVERASGRVVEGDARPQEVTEIWTFMRGRGGDWILSAIQQA